ncbi:DNA replication licensing factor MCM8, putative [Schistosoma mansoni]|uniref:DNA replication licensing factor MCM8, putative n=1 Tax=Schistosoma mansoni TaxID=6183 RepID=UPI00022C839B|nr:DNA replication licensing factor MCM8, putative [Schistosoma mansoni]|eukprot:XP_018646085.1 DNA replication licensing factor MCM8, putative [Schistosoma mansoni]
MTYSILNTSGHPLKHLLKLSHNTNLRGNTQKLETLHSRTDCRYNFYSVRVVKFWNSLPTKLVQATSQESFKRFPSKSKVQSDGGCKRKPDQIKSPRTCITNSSENGFSQLTDSLGIDSINSGFLNQKALPLASFNKSCPYPGWLLYFPTRLYENSSKITLDFLTDLVQKSGYNLLSNPYTINHVSNFVGNTLDWIKIETQGAVLIDYSSIIHSKLLQDKLQINKYFGDHVIGGIECAEYCEIILRAFGLALHTLCYRTAYKHDSVPDIFKVENESIGVNTRLPGYIAARIVNHSPITPLRKLRAHHLGQFISVKGIVVRLGPVEPVCHRLVFECCRCEMKQVLILPDNGNYATPSKCPTKDCRSRSFEPLLNHPDTLTIDTQIVTIQEASSDNHEIDGNHRDASSSSVTSIGRSARCLACRLERDLIDSCIPGDVLHLTGLIGLISSDGLGASSSSSSSAYSSSWSSRRGATMYSLIMNVNNNEFSMKDLYAIREISEQPNLFRLLVCSLCPSICGRGLIKAGLILALFGGTQSTTDRNVKQFNYESSFVRRSASHVLIVGDPGLGKSQLLRAAASLAPRVLYVCGNTATAAGLTVSTIREGNNSGGGFGLEAGALVLADQGCCCIDEFDKLTCDPAVLLEAMEQQSVSVARGGLVANLPARAAVLAAANPINGHYDITRRLDENLRIPSALLSRFDLIFVLLDHPDEVADRLLSEHVTAVHTGNWRPSSFICSQAVNQRDHCMNNNNQNCNVGARGGTIVQEFDSSIPLSQRLELLVELRKHRHSRDTFPVTLRQLESLIRLTQARARAELREEATKQDALDVCELMQSTGLGSGFIAGTPANVSLSEMNNVLNTTFSKRINSSSTGPGVYFSLMKHVYGYQE